MRFPRGSEWRRWDLHIHTPETALNNGFGEWDEYLDTIESEQVVKVLGITDYFTITNYSKLKTYREAGRLSGIDLLIPNIEFRIAPPNNKAIAINIHLLVCPDDVNHERKIEQALSRLTWDYDGHTYACTRDQLIDLGRATKPRVHDDCVALEAGVTQFKVDFSTMRDWLQKEHWLRENSLVAVAAGDDGLSGFSNTGSWASYREEITRFSQLIFSGRPGERDYWLGLRKPEDLETIQNLGGYKPCIHGSDAHEISRLFKPDHNRFCWIRADTTFEGLKQILYEPQDRVHIGPSPPLFYDKTRVVSSVRLSNAEGWFDDTVIPINNGLISIIGQKGSGKSALAETIAYAAGCHVNDEEGSFLLRARPHLQNLKIELTWCDDSVSSTQLGVESSESVGARYLSQRFVERLCGGDQIGDELVAEIEAVVFSHLDPIEKLNASDFRELRSMRTENVQIERERIRTELAELTREQCSLIVRDNKLDLLADRIQSLVSERQGLTKQLPKPVTIEEIKRHEDLNARRKLLTDAQQKAVVFGQELQKIQDLRDRIESFETQMQRFFLNIKETLVELNIPDALRDSFRPTFHGNTKIPLAHREEEIKQQLKTLLGDRVNPAPQTIQWLKSEIDGLHASELEDRARDKRLREIRTRITNIEVEVDRLESEKKKIEGPERERIQVIKKARMNAYVAYFENLKHEQQVLESLYQPVATRVVNDYAVDKQKKLEFSIRWEADLDYWLEQGSSLFDQRKKFSNSTIEELKLSAENVLRPAWTSGCATKVRLAMDTFLAEFRQEHKRTESMLRAGASMQDFLEWVFDVRHVRLNYGLKYHGVDLEKLSPGTKGIVLLILYLGMDVNNSTPLIVDQPDENLDNESIYELLVSYFREAKKHRQIFLVTHNPNLVVNTDSDQVVIARATRRENGLPHITYRSGSLENDVPNGQSIRDQVCRILEGGSDAFQTRKRRYAFK